MNSKVLIKVFLWLALCANPVIHQEIPPDDDDKPCFQPPCPDKQPSVETTIRVSTRTTVSMTTEGTSTVAESTTEVKTQTTGKLPITTVRSTTTEVIVSTTTTTTASTTSMPENGTVSTMGPSRDGGAFNVVVIIIIAVLMATGVILSATGYVVKIQLARRAVRNVSVIPRWSTTLGEGDVELYNVGWAKREREDTVVAEARFGAE